MQPTLSVSPPSLLASLTLCSLSLSRCCHQICNSANETQVVVTPVWQQRRGVGGAGGGLPLLTAPPLPGQK